MSFVIYHFDQTLYMDACLDAPITKRETTYKHFGMWIE